MCSPEDFFRSTAVEGLYVGIFNVSILNIQ